MSAPIITSTILESAKQDSWPQQPWWMVIRIGSSGSTKADAMPTVHYKSMEEAQMEARRLAAMMPTHPRGFAVVEVKSVIRGFVDTYEMKFVEKSPDAPTSGEPWTEIARDLSHESPLIFGWAEKGTFQRSTNYCVVVDFLRSLRSHTLTLFWPQAVKKIEDRLSSKLGRKIKFRATFLGKGGAK